MKILLVGNGGREHALAWRLAQSPSAPELFATRPNAGLARLARAVDLGVDQVTELVSWALEHQVDLTIVGPELPLTLGIVDRFEEAGLAIWGPSQAAARLEGSKAFAKDVMTRAGVPTAEYAAFADLAKAKAWVREFGRPVVVKADGLAAGKGVILCQTAEEAERALDSMLMDGAFGDAGSRVVVEELLLGEEASFIALCDGVNVLPLASSQDHKRVGEGDTGPNTGGMGAYSPAPVVDADLEQRIIDQVMLPTIRTLAEMGAPFVGFLYAGIMVTKAGPKVLEFNVRMGDPETQPLMMRLQSDLIEVLQMGLAGRLHEVALNWDPRSALTVVMCSEGYPLSARKGDAIRGLDEAGEVSDAHVFLAGAKLEQAEVLTNGGRVLGVTALGDTLHDAASRAYEAVDCISWPGAHFRSDIGWRAL
jgi:phosphoribosylamine---glycine ligase